MSTDRQASEALRAAAPTATVAGSTALVAALTAQDTLDALAIAATSVTTGATVAWTVTGPTGTSETAQLITAGADTATPTWAAFSAASGQKYGTFRFQCVITAGSLSTTYVRTLLIGTAALSVSIAAIADQLTLAAATIDTTVTGAIGSVTYGHLVNGATTGLSDATAADPTFTPTTAGTHTAVCAVTDAAGRTATFSRAFTVGDTDARVQTHAVDWTDAGVAGTKTIGGSETLDGISIGYTTGGGGSPSVVAGATGLVVTPNGAWSVSYEWTGSDTGPGTWTIGQSWVLFLALDASLLASGDNMTLAFLNGTNRVYCRFHYSAGQKVGVAMIRAGSTTETVFSLDAHPRMIALEYNGTTAEIRYSTTAYAGAFPALTAMTKCMSSRTGNRFGAFNPSVVDSAEVPAISGSTARVTVQGSARTIAAHALRIGAAR